MTSTGKVDLTPAEKAAATRRKRAIAAKVATTARWAKTMTSWLITHSSKGGVKWQVVNFNGPTGAESKGIVDMIAIRKNHRAHAAAKSVGDIFEICLIQVKGGSAPFPTHADVDRLMAVKKYHNADKVVLVEWKRSQALNCYLLPNMDEVVSASSIFGKTPSASVVKAMAASPLPIEPG